jgi:hypothetical protein
MNKAVILEELTSEWALSVWGGLPAGSGQAFRADWLTRETPAVLLPFPHCRTVALRIRLPHPIMPTEIFKASRWTRGNFLFPTYIEVNEQAVTRHKRSWFSRDEISVSMSKVASVHIKTGMVWSDILIESSGGSDPLTSHGHTKSDAQRIKELVETYQAAFARNPSAAG